MTSDTGCLASNINIRPHWGKVDPVGSNQTAHDRVGGNRGWVTGSLQTQRQGDVRLQIAAGSDGWEKEFSSLYFNPNLDPNLKPGLRQVLTGLHSPGRGFTRRFYRRQVECV
jgi:hypothetical protein